MQIVLEGVAGSGYYSDMAVDDVLIIPCSSLDDLNPGKQLSLTFNERKRNVYLFCVISIRETRGRGNVTETRNTGSLKGMDDALLNELFGGRPLDQKLIHIIISAHA